jgi:hypothetical protein
MAAIAADRDLRCGLIALQNGLIDQAASGRYGEAPAYTTPGQAEGDLKRLGLHSDVLLQKALGLHYWYAGRYRTEDPLDPPRALPGFQVLMLDVNGLLIAPRWSGLPASSSPTGQILRVRAPRLAPSPDSVGDNRGKRAMIGAGLPRQFRTLRDQRRSIPGSVPGHRPERLNRRSVPRSDTHPLQGESTVGRRADGPSIPIRSGRLRRVCGLK